MVIFIKINKSVNKGFKLCTNPVGWGGDEDPPAVNDRMGRLVATAAAAPRYQGTCIAIARVKMQGTEDRSLLLLLLPGIPQLVRAVEPQLSAVITMRRGGGRIKEGEILVGNARRAAWMFFGDLLLLLPPPPPLLHVIRVISSAAAGGGQGQARGSQRRTGC